MTCEAKQSNVSAPLLLLQGGVVVWAGTWRVGGVLAVSRAFGDKPLKRYVIATPDVRDEKIAPEDEFLILASDGLWDVCMNQVRQPRLALLSIAQPVCWLSLARAKSLPGTCWEAPRFAPPPFGSNIKPLPAAQAPDRRIATVSTIS